jgi:Zn finger protein HypA/HybF involved in hydrogenase expression
MTTLRINRFSLSEIETVTVRCKQCGAGHILKLDRDAFRAGVCPSCGKEFGKISHDIFHSLREAAFGLSATGDFDIEFDILDK